jgi:hypothetical protein
MSGEHTLTEQLYLAFHDWRARVDADIDRLDVGYLRALHTDMLRAGAHIEHELAAGSGAAQRDEDRTEGTRRNR